MSFPVVILAGGLATRMRPATETMPKALIPVNGRPFAELQLEWLRSIGVSHVVFSIGYRGDQICEAIGGGKRFDLSVDYISDGDRLLGTGGALRVIADSGMVPESFGVINGDSFLTLNPDDVEPAYLQSGKPALMTVMHNRDRWDRSNVIFHDGNVLLYDKHASGDARIGMEWIDYGYLILSRQLILDRVAPGEPSDLSDLLHELSKEGQLAGFEVEKRFYEVGSPQGLRDLELALSKGGKN